MKTFWIAGGVVAGIVVLTTIIVVPLVLTSGKGGTVAYAGAKFEPDGSPLDFFSVDDGLSVKWYHGVNSRDQLDEALAGDYMMLEGDIIFRWQGLPNQTNELIMAHPPDINSDLSLENWLSEILDRTDKGLKLDFKNLEVVRPSLELLVAKKDKVSHPVWANADIVPGPGSTNPPIDADSFLGVVNELWPKMTLSLGWMTECCDPFTRPMMVQMFDIVKDVNQPVSFPARAGSFKESWEHFKWLLDQDPARFSITVWTPSGDLDWEGADLFDMLHIRNSVHKSLIYYDLPGPKFEAFKQLCATAGSPLNHFPLEKRDGLYVSWAHAVNSEEMLEEVLGGDLMMLEADVLLQGQGTENETDIPIMAHPPDIYSDITLEEWLDRVIESGTNKGIKLDFKSTAVLEPSMRILRERKDSFTQPVWLNADIFRGPNSFSNGRNATEFKRLVSTYFPESTWSVGWTTVWTNTVFDRVYTRAMVDEMSEYLKDVKQPVTLPLRAAMLRRSWHLFEEFLDDYPQHTITVWSSKNDQVDPDDMVYVRQHSERDRIFYDLPEPLMSDFLDRLNITLPLQ